MLKVNVGVSRKVSKDYNSRGFSLNLEGEVAVVLDDPEVVVARIKELYDLAEEALDQQIERAQSDDAMAKHEETAPRTNGPSRVSANGANGHRNGAGHDEPPPATEKQINYLLNIARRQKLSTSALEDRIADVLGHAVGLYELTKTQAAQVIDRLTGEATQNRVRAAG